VDEVPGEMVEQFGMGGAFAEETEIVGGGNDSATEEMMPDAVDQDACDQGIGRLGQLTGEFDPTAGVGVGDGLQPQGGREGTGSGFGMTPGFAAHQHMGIDTGTIEPGDGGAGFPTDGRGEGIAC